MDNKSRYYCAYEERYKAVHKQGYSWASEKDTPVVLDTICKYGISKQQKILEIGCGEGRDSKSVLESGYKLLATDISEEAINYCKIIMPGFADNFSVLDCLSDTLCDNFDFIYAVAVVHMLVLDEDRNGFYRFVFDHLNDDGLALICTMGDGDMEVSSDITKAFDIQERNHESGKMMVAATSCRMVSFDTFEKEIIRNDFEIVEKGITSSLPDFDKLMYAIVRKKNKG